MNFNLSASQPTCQPASLPACHETHASCARCMAPEFLHNKGDHIDCCSSKHLPTATQCFLFLLSFLLQITYRKVRNFQIGGGKLVRKASLHHTKSTTCIISIIVNALAVVYAQLSCQSCAVEPWLSNPQLSVPLIIQNGI